TPTCMTQPGPQSGCGTDTWTTLAWRWPTDGAGPPCITWTLRPPQIWRPPSCSVRRWHDARARAEPAHPAADIGRRRLAPPGRLPRRRPGAVLPDRDRRAGPGTGQAGEGGLPALPRDR